MGEDLVLPLGTRLLHIGPQKTGTTAIQSALHEARKDLAEHDLYVPKGGWRRREASWALGLGSPRRAERPDMAEWKALIEEVRAANGSRVCVSNEDFAHADAHTIERIVHDLGGDRAHVVAVARALHRYLPSQWQERIKAGQRRSFDKWLKVILDGDDSRSEWRNVWSGRDTVPLVNRWLKVVPPEAFTLVILDEDDRRQLPGVFERMLGLPEGLLVPLGGRNASLSYAETEVIRHLNRTTAAHQWSKLDRADLIRSGLIAHLKRQDEHAPGPRLPAIPEWAASAIEKRTEERIEDIAQLPVRIVGDLENLRGGWAAEGQGTTAPRTVPVTWAADAIASVVDAALRRETAEPPSRRARTTPATPSKPARKWPRLLHR